MRYCWLTEIPGVLKILGKGLWCYFVHSWTGWYATPEDRLFDYHCKKCQRTWGWKGCY